MYGLFGPQKMNPVKFSNILNVPLALQKAAKCNDRGHMTCKQLRHQQHINRHDHPTTFSNINQSYGHVKLTNK